MNREDEQCATLITDCEVESFEYGFSISTSPGKFESCSLKLPLWTMVNEGLNQFRLKKYFNHSKIEIETRWLLSRIGELRSPEKYRCVSRKNDSIFNNKNYNQKIK